jgi:UDP-N-acetylglucosamine--N-acetylmuramyl-(pentapeptide) pyrophosphoryl-undecaprenol N-acetylglucosamine transferase
MKLFIAAGGTGGHIFPALSVAQEWKRRFPSDGLHWVGTSRSREKELCDANGIPLTMLAVSGVKRRLSLESLGALIAFVRAIGTVYNLMKQERPDAVLTFGGYVSAPVAAAARLRHVPAFQHEQNTVPGLVTRLFSLGSRCTLLAFELAVGQRLAGRTLVVGMPVRRAAERYDAGAYPAALKRSGKTVLVTGGSQGALSMDRLLMNAIEIWLGDGMQVVWQTGDAGYQEVVDRFGARQGLFVYKSIPDLYPYYAVSKVVVGRSGASTLGEAAYFGVPCVLIPLPWATANHQWTNAGLVEAQGWAVRVKQDDRCGAEVARQVKRIVGDDRLQEHMSQRALDSSPSGAASDIVQCIRDSVTGR